MSTHAQQYLTQQEAAVLAEVSLDTVKRHRKKGLFPGARRRDDRFGTWEIPYGDLVTAGLVTAGAQSPEEITQQIGLSRTSRQLVELTERLQAATHDAKSARQEVARLSRIVDAAAKEKDRLLVLLATALDTPPAAEGTSTEVR